MSPYLALGLAPLLWAGNFLVGKLVGDALPPFTLAAVRWTIGLLILAPLAWRGGTPIVARRWWPSIAVLGTTGVFFFTALVYAALRDTAAVNASLIQAAIPAATVVLSLLFLRERASLRQWLGILAAFLGVAWIVAGGHLEALAALRLNRGDALMLANVVFWSVYSLVAQRVLREVRSTVATFWSTFVGLALLVPIGAWEMVGHPWPEPTPALVAALLYLGIFPTVVAYLLWNRGVAALGAGRAAPFANLLPLYTAFLAVPFAGESIGLHHLIGGALIAGGVFLGTRR